MRSQTFLVTCVIIEVLKIYIILLNEVVMLVDREGRVARGKGGGKTIFPCLDGSFGFIVTVSVWGEIIGIWHCFWRSLFLYLLGIHTLGYIVLEHNHLTLICCVFWSMHQWFWWLVYLWWVCRWYNLRCNFIQWRLSFFLIRIALRYFCFGKKKACWYLFCQLWCKIVHQFLCCWVIGLELHPGSCIT